jgi:hypothetical protein
MAKQRGIVSPKLGPYDVTVLYHDLSLSSGRALSNNFSLHSALNGMAKCQLQF